MSDDRVQPWLDALAYDTPTTEGPASAAVNTVRAGTQPFAEAFQELLKQLAEDHTRRQAEFDLEEAEVARNLDALCAEFSERIVEFLAQAQPGALSSSAREVYRRREEFFRRLRLSLSELNRAVLKRTQDLEQAENPRSSRSAKES